MTEHRLLRTPEDKKTRHNQKMGSVSRPPRTMPRRWLDHYHHQQQQEQQHSKEVVTQLSSSPVANAADDRSRNSDSTAGKNSTPSSVLINGHPLTRDLSDLSGSYYGTTTPSYNSSNNKIPRNVYPQEGGVAAASKQKPWRKARVLSSRRPQHPQPPADDCGDSFIFGLRNHEHRQQVLLVDSEEGDGDIEAAVHVLQQAGDHNSSTSSSNISMLYSPALMLAADSSLSGDAVHQPNPHNCRAPLLLLLMDPARKLYELMQLWVDISSDTVRDVLHAIQQNLGESRWRQDYDGLFQVRNNHFSQLIHILNISKYDVQPYELWIAKPWSMAAKHTAGYAGELLNHLKQIGLLTYQAHCNKTNNNSNNNNNKFLPPKPPTDSDAYLVLSPEAKSRIYVPEGILKHHHACQFLTFSPPFESQIVDVLSDQICMDDGSTSQLSESQLGYGLSSVSFEDNGSLAASSVKAEDNNRNSSSSAKNGSNNSNNETLVILPSSTLSTPEQIEEAAATATTNSDSDHHGDHVDLILGSLTSLHETLFARAATRPPTPPSTSRTQSPPVATRTSAGTLQQNEHGTPTTSDIVIDTDMETSCGVYWDDDDNQDEEGQSEFEVAPGYCHPHMGRRSSSGHNIQSKLQQQRQALLRAIRSLNCVVGCRPKHGRQQQRHHPHYRQKSNNKYAKTPTSTTTSASSVQQQQDGSETLMGSPSSPLQTSSTSFLWHAWEDTIVEGDESVSLSSSFGGGNRSFVSESMPLLLERVQTSDS